MKAAFLAGLVGVTLLGGCSTNYNPFNWFGGSSDEPVTLEPRDGYDETADRRPMVDRVVSMSVERTIGGAIVTAVGLPPTQGYWRSGLVPELAAAGGDPVPDENGTMVLQFRIIPAPAGSRVGTQQSRELSAALFLTDQTLRGVRRIVVRGNGNQQSSSR